MSEAEMEVFSLLEKSGLPFQDAVDLAFNQHDEITHLLRQGVPFFEIVRHQKGRHLQRMASLMEYFSLPLAVKYDQQLQESRQVISKKLFSNSVYPLFIMAFATALIYFFSSSILPAFSAFESEDTALLDTLKLLCTVFWIIMVILGGVIIHLLWSPASRFQSLSLLFRIPVLRILCSCECAALFECTQNSALSTSQTLTFMSTSKDFPFASMLARKWKKNLSKGDSLFSCICKDRRLDPAFIRFFQIGGQVSLMESMMKAYQESALLRLQRITKKVSNYILYFAYGSVGLLAVSVYQIMLAPLNLLESF